MNVSEFIVKYLEEKQIDRVFGVVGGAVLWICKALKESKSIKPVFTNHEQAATMAADGWARISGKPGIVFTINGPGMTNTITGIAQAWVDSSPVIVITGNSNSKSVQYERERNVRQYGTQDIRTDLLMKPITKKFFFVEEPAKIKAYLDEAFYTALSDRPGPIGIEIPINIQSAEVPEQLLEWVFPQRSQEKQTEIESIIRKISCAKRPLILAGQGVRLSNSVALFRRFLEKYQLPVVNSRMGIDSINSDSRYFVGRAGNHGSRAAHFSIQTCDVLLILGSRLAPNTTGYDVGKFSTQSYKILIDIDETELEKFQLKIDESVCIDLKDFFEIGLSIKNIEYSIDKREKWLACCLSWRERYPIMQQEYYDNTKISTYRLVDCVSSFADTDSLILSDTGSCCSIVAQVWNIKKRQRLFISGGLSAMGYWVTAMGLAIASKSTKQVICFVGDGSLQMNIHELATIKQYNLPIKIFVVNNNGYQFVRMSQSGYGINPPFGTDVSAGVPLPGMKKIVEAYQLKYVGCNQLENLDSIIRDVLTQNCAVVCEIFVDEDQEVCPRLRSIAKNDGTFESPKYENLFPFLDEQVLCDEIAREGV